MKPFDPTKPVQQRCGRAARIICTDSKAICGITPQPIVAEFLGDDDRWRVSTFRSDGGFGYIHEDERDLINIPETKKIKFWVNVYQDSFVGDVYNTKEAATTCRLKHCFACIEIEREVKEGEGL